MTTNQKLIVIEKIEKSYDFDGRKGVSLAVRCLVGINVFRLKISKELLDTIEVEKTYMGDIEIRSMKEDPILTLVAVKKVSA